MDILKTVFGTGLTRCHEDIIRSGKIAGDDIGWSLIKEENGEERLYFSARVYVLASLAIDNCDSDEAKKNMIAFVEEIKNKQSGEIK